MSKKKITILVSSVVLSFLLITVFAAFIFKSDILGTAGTGTITLESKSYLDYSIPNKDSDKSDTNALLDRLSQRIPAGSEPKRIDASSGSITCYATKRNGYTNEDTSLIYLNQLGFEFSFKASLDSYIRIHFEDNGITKESYITKDKLNSGKSPFSIDTIKATKNGITENPSFVYIEDQNYLYIKSPVAGDGAINTYSLNIDPNLPYYTLDEGVSFREQILVEVTYIVDIVQANRAEAKWGVSLDEIFKEVWWLWKEIELKK